MKFHHIWNGVLFAILCAAAAPPSVEAATLRMVVQSVPEAGGKCVTVPNGQFVEGAQLQMSDCDSSSAQVFVYDDQTEELKSDAACVTSLGHGDPQDAVGLRSCNGAAEQHWQVVASGNYYEFTGANGLCLMVGQAAANAAPLRVFTCTEGNVVQLWTLVEAPDSADAAAANQTNAAPATSPASSGQPATAAAPAQPANAPADASAAAETPDASAQPPDVSDLIGQVGDALSQGGDGGGGGDNGQGQGPGGRGKGQGGNGQGQGQNQGANGQGQGANAQSQTKTNKTTGTANTGENKTGNSQFPNKLPSDVGGKSTTSSNSQFPNKLPSDVGGKSTTSSNSQFPNKLPSDVGGKSTTSSNSQFPNKLPSDVGGKSTTSSNSQFPNKLPSDVGGKSTTSSNSQFPNKLPSDVGGKSTTLSNSQFPNKLPSDTGGKSTTSSNAQFPNKLPSDAGDKSARTSGGGANNTNSGGKLALQKNTIGGSPSGEGSRSSEKTASLGNSESQKSATTNGGGSAATGHQPGGGNSNGALQLKKNPSNTESHPAGSNGTPATNSHSPSESNANGANHPGNGGSASTNAGGAKSLKSNQIQLQKQNPAAKTSGAGKQASLTPGGQRFHGASSGHAGHATSRGTTSRHRAATGRRQTRQAFRPRRVAQMHPSHFGGGGFRGFGGHGGGGGGGGRRHSDVRLKQDIVPVGSLDNGIGLYRFRYKGSDSTFYVGVMAQQVQTIVPGAVSRGRDGYLLVDYDLLGVKFMTWNQWIGRNRTALPVTP